MGFSLQRNSQVSASSNWVPAGVRLTRELRTIMPRISAMLAAAANADVCSVFVYDEHQERTVAVFRHGMSDEGLAHHLWTNPMSPWDIPAEAEVLRSARPLVRSSPDDFERWPMAVPGQEKDERRLSDMVLPLVWNDRVHGTAYLWRVDDPTPFKEHEISAAEDVSRMAAMAVVFAREYEHERSLRLQVNTLLDVASIASSHLGLHDTLPALANSMRAASGADVCNLYVYDEAERAVIGSFTSGLNRDEERALAGNAEIPVDEVPIETRIWETHETVLVADPERELGLGTPIGRYAVKIGLTEVLVVPIVHHPTMVGVVYLWNRDLDRRFSEKSIAAIEAIANHAGGVISRARLHEATEQQAQERQALLRIGQAVLSSDSLDSVLDEIAATLAQAIQYDYAFVALLNDARTHVTVQRDWGDRAGEIVHFDLPLDRSLTGVAVQTGSLVSVPDIESEQRAMRFDLDLPPLRSVLIAPLSTENGTIGALFVGRLAAGSFSTREERLMSLLSQQAAWAIERVRSRDALARRERRQAFLASVVDRLVVESDPTSVIPEIAEMAVGVLADGVIIGLASWEYGGIRWSTAVHRDPAVQQRMHRALETLRQESLSDQFEEVLTTDKTVIYRADTSDRNGRILTSMMHDLAAREMAMVPLSLPERASGVMILVKSESEPTGFQPETLELARVVASRIGDALDRSQMNRNRAALLRVSQAMHRQTDLDELLENLARELESILPFDQLLLSELDSIDAVTHPRVFINRSRFSSTERVMPTDIGLSGEALRTRRPILDNQAHKRATTHYLLDSERTFFQRHGESAMVTPLIVDDDVKGVLFLNRRGRNRFTYSDFETFLLFAGLAAAAIDRTSLIQHNKRLYRASVEVIAATVDARDPSTLEHSRNVSRYSKRAAEAMELSADEVERIELAGLMHDIGKLGIPEEILRKREGLTEEEIALINSHPERAARILRQHPALTGLIPLVRHQHERWDGTGYPDGLAGTDIPLGSSIIAVADAFDSVMAEAAHGDCPAVDSALGELERDAGTRFNPAVVERFVASIRRQRTYERVGRSA